MNIQVVNSPRWNIYRKCNLIFFQSLTFVYSLLRSMKGEHILIMSFVEISHAGIGRCHWPPCWDIYLGTWSTSPRSHANPNEDE